MVVGLVEKQGEEQLEKLGREQEEEERRREEEEGGGGGEVSATSTGQTDADFNESQRSGKDSDVKSQIGVRATVRATR